MEQLQDDPGNITIKDPKRSYVKYASMKSRLFNHGKAVRHMSSLHEKASMGSWSFKGENFPKTHSMCVFYNKVRPLRPGNFHKRQGVYS